MTTHRHTPIICPYCSRTFDAATSPYGDDPPMPGAISVCFYCAGLAIFTGDSMRKPTDVERADLLDDPSVVDIMSAILAYRAVEE